MVCLRKACHIGKTKNFLKKSIYQCHFITFYCFLSFICHASFTFKNCFSRQVYFGCFARVPFEKMIKNIQKRNHCCGSSMLLLHCVSQTSVSLLTRTCSATELYWVLKYGNWFTFLTPKKFHEFLTGVKWISMVI